MCPFPAMVNNIITTEISIQLTFCYRLFVLFIIVVHDNQRQRQKDNYVLRLRHSNPNVKQDLSQFYTIAAVEKQ
jgi:hypothetical protein